MHAPKSTIFSSIAVHGTIAVWPPTIFSTISKKTQVQSPSIDFPLATHNFLALGVGWYMVARLKPQVQSPSASYLSPLQATTPIVFLLCCHLSASRQSSLCLGYTEWREPQLSPPPPRGVASCTSPHSMPEG